MGHVEDEELLHFGGMEEINTGKHVSRKVDSAELLGLVFVLEWRHLKGGHNALI